MRDWYFECWRDAVIEKRSTEAQAELAALPVPPDLATLLTELDACPEVTAQE